MNQAQNAADLESQKYRHKARVAAQYKHAASSLDMQLQARARSPGVDSNLTIPDAANIARDVLAAITAAQQQMILEQRRIEEQLATMMVSQKETLDSQRIAFSTKVRRTRTEIQESMRSANPIEQSQTSWRATSPAYIQPPQMMPRQQVQPWEIPTGSPRAPSPPRDRPQNERASLEWNMIKAGMTCRAKQKEDYDIQGNSIDSSAIGGDIVLELTPSFFLLILITIK